LKSTKPIGSLAWQNYSIRSSKRRREIDEERKRQQVLARIFAKRNYQSEEKIKEIQYLITK